MSVGNYVIIISKTATLGVATKLYLNPYSECTCRPEEAKRKDATDEEGEM